VDWLRNSARKDSDAPALVTAAGAVSYGELDAAASQVAAAAIGSGVCAGHRVAVRGDGTAEAVAAIWGIPRAGATVVVLDGQLRADEAMALANRTGVRAIWGREQIIGEENRLAESGWGPPHAGFRIIVFTSGTQGAPRPVVLTGANVEAAAASSQRRLGNGPGDSWLCVLPLHHIGGLSILWRAARQGASVLLEERFDSKRAAALLREAAFVSLVPTMLYRLLDVVEGPFPGLRGVLVGGAAADVALLERALDAGLPVLATYGMTETASQVATVAPGEERSSLGTVGRPLDGLELRIVGGGAEVEAGVSGRIEVRGPVVSPGMLDGLQREAGDWLCTGDIGVLDGHGRLRVLGRADDVIITGGENVHPSEIEAAVRLHDGVADVRVYGIDDPEWGQAVAADVVARQPGALDVNELEALVRRRLPGFKVPKRWRLVPHIERSELGKARGG
jgi:O-succinylbenzoic acid--CoA ligase